MVRADASRPDWKPILGGLVFSVAVGALVSTQRDSDVSGGSFVFGVIIGAGLLGALPV